MNRTAIIVILVAISSVSLVAAVVHSTSLSSLRAARHRHTTKAFTVKRVKVWRRVAILRRHPRRATVATKVDAFALMKHVQQEKIKDLKNSHRPSHHSGSSDPSERTKEVLVKGLVPQTGAEFKDTARLKELPAQPVDKLRVQLSFILANSNVTDKINGATVSCHAKATATKAKDWGVYGADRFTHELAHVKYYALLAEDEASNFASTVDRFVRKGDLTTCLQNANVGFPMYAQAFAGRVVMGPVVASVPRGDWAPIWALAILLGIAAVVGIVMLVTTAFWHDNRKKLEYESVDDEEEIGNEMARWMT